MNWKRELRNLLDRVAAGQCPVEEALSELKDLPFEDLGFARLDPHRELRTGVPEVIFAERKETGHLIAIVRHLQERGRLVLASRVDPAQGKALLAEFPQGCYHERARLFSIRHLEEKSEPKGPVFVLAAGTSDLPVAEEAVVTAELLGNRVEKLYDVGVAGLQRLLPEMERIRTASVTIVVAGMEGALPSVVAGLVGGPVIAVPTSVGYGSSFGGVTALLAMLNSCVPGVTVVNIDNGVGAGVAAHLINAKIS